MMSVIQQLETGFVQAGGTKETFDRILKGGLGPGDLGRQDGTKEPEAARALAQRCLREGVLIEYQCYDARGRDQGSAIARFEKWENLAALQFRATHLIASDEYYEWWAAKNLAVLGVVYHFCEDKRSRCKTVNVAGVENIHVGSWRLVSPLNLMGHPYGEAAALAEVQRGLENQLLLLPQPSLPGPSGGGGAQAAVTTTGLDGALGSGIGGEGLDDPRFEEMMALAKEAKGAKEDPARKSVKKKAKHAFGQVLADRAKLHQEERSRSRGKDQTREPRRSADLERSRKRKAAGLNDEVTESDSDCRSSDELDFRGASSREVDLILLSKKNPGCLLRSALQEMSRYLAARGEASKEDPSQGRVLAYVHQILLPQYPKAGLRSQRELVTLGTALDHLLDGDLGRCGDLLVQRFKAVEASLAADGNWALAKHQELIPGQASLSTRAELTEAAKAELRAQKLKSALHKSTK